MINKSDSERYLFLAAKREGKYVGSIVFEIRKGDCHNENLTIAYQVQMLTWGDSPNNTSMRLLKRAESALTNRGIQAIHLSFPEKAENSERFHSLINRMGYEDNTRTYIKEIQK